MHSGGEISIQWRPGEESFVLQMLSHVVTKLCAAMMIYYVFGFWCVAGMFIHALSSVPFCKE